MHHHEQNLLKSQICVPILDTILYVIFKFIKKLGTFKMSILASPNPFTSSSPPLSSKPIVESLGEFLIKRTRRSKFFAPS
jgi:hypothetical protein